jgi:uncharacterized lipoprotein YbaY
MRLFASLAGAGFLALAACSPAPETPVADPGPEGAPTAAVTEGATEDEAHGVLVSGQVTWDDSSSLPDDTALHVEIRDLDLGQDAAPLKVLITVVDSGSPLEFAWPVPVDSLPEGANLGVRARLQSGYAILFASDGAVDIADTGETAGLQIELFNPEDLARGAPRPMITPAGTDYTCGGEALTIAVEAGAAYVTFADGNSVKLNKLATADGANTQFSNGKMLVEQADDGLRFGRGRAVPQACTPTG